MLFAVFEQVKLSFCHINKLIVVSAVLAYGFVHFFGMYTEISYRRNRKRCCVIYNVFVLFAKICMVDIHNGKSFGMTALFVYRVSQFFL